MTSQTACPWTLGGTAVSTVHLDSYLRLLDLLGIRDEEPLMLSQTSHTVDVSEAVRWRLGADFIGLWPGGDQCAGPAAHFCRRVGRPSRGAQVEEGGEFRDLEKIPLSRICPLDPCSDRYMLGPSSMIHLSRSKPHSCYQTRRLTDSTSSLYFCCFISFSSGCRLGAALLA